jgi:hypothetical protein
MSINFTTDDVWDEAEAMGLHKPSKPKKPPAIKSLYNDKGEFLIKGTFIDINKYFKKNFNLTSRWFKKGRLKIYIEEIGYKII